MRVTEKMVREASFGASLATVQELTLSNKGIADIGDLEKAENLQSLNVALNNLRSLAGLSLKQLRTLNAMRNKIRSLEGASLPELRVLKLSFNALSSLQGLEGLPALAELWINNNQITDIGELQRLSACPCLRALALRPNPGVDAIDEPTYRAAVARACPDLELLDGKPITAAERAGAERAPDLSALAAHQVSSAPESAGSPGIASAVEGTLERTAEDLRLAKQQSFDRSLLERNLATTGGNVSRKGLYTGVKSRIDTGAKAGPRQEKVIEVPEGVNALELVQGILPALTDPSIKGPPRVARDPKKLSSAIVTADMDPNAHAVKFEAKYEGESAGTQAVMVKGDGSAMARYPDDAMAVSVNSSVSGGRVVYSMMAMYRNSGSLALTFDVDGSGCVQYPNGQLMVTYNALEGTGMVLSRAGEITETLRGGPGAGCRDYALDDHLGVRLDLEGQEHAVYFAAGSVKHKFVLGRNEPAATWDDDPAFAASLSRSVRATARVDRPHAGKAPLNKTISGRMAEIAGTGGAMAALGSDLVARIRMLEQMDAAAGITFGDAAVKDDWRKELQGASEFSLPQQPKHTEDAEPDAKRPAETASPGQKKAQLPKAGALPSWGA